LLADLLVLAPGDFVAAPGLVGDIPVEEDIFEKDVPVEVGILSVADQSRPTETEEVFQVVGSGLDGDMTDLGEAGTPGVDIHFVGEFLAEGSREEVVVEGLGLEGLVAVLVVVDTL